MNEINKADFARKPDGGLAEQIEVLEAKCAKLMQRLQDTCSHTHGRIYESGKAGCCSNCGWDLDKCQHKVSRQRGDNFCTECGEKLR